MDTDPWRSIHPFTTERIGAAAIYCSDGRYGEQFDDFLHNRLTLPRYDRFAIPGGAGVLAGHPAAYREEEALLDQLRFLITSHGLERVVLIAHKNCGFYLKRLHLSEDRIRPRQEEDLAKAAETIRGISPRLQIDAYFAAVHDTTVVIEPVAI